MSGKTKAITRADAIQTIKSAILRSRYHAAALANAELLMLYFRIGGYISKNSRKGFWGAGAIGEISRQLQKDLPGLRGFSATNMKYMRLFYEAWAGDIKSSVATDDLGDEIRQLPTAELELLDNCEVNEIRQLQLTNLTDGVLSIILCKSQNPIGSGSTGGSSRVTAASCRRANWRQDAAYPFSTGKNKNGKAVHNTFPTPTGLPHAWLNKPRQPRWGCIITQTGTRGRRLHRQPRAIRGNGFAVLVTSLNGYDAATTLEGVVKRRPCRGGRRAAVRRQAGRLSSPDRRGHSPNLFSASV